MKLLKPTSYSGCLVVLEALNKHWFDLDPGRELGELRSFPKVVTTQLKCYSGNPRQWFA